MRDAHFFERTPIDDLYRWFADETAATSPTWQRLCLWVAGEPEVHRPLGALPGQARQPNRFLAAIRYLGGPTEPGDDFREWFEGEWPRIRPLLLTRTTQTNEPGRCAVTAPLLASLDGPVSLLELGASAGLCLLPDRYAYQYDDSTPLRAPAATDASPVLRCDVEGPAPADPQGLVVAARLGVDLNPLDPRDDDTRRWLRALVWPGEEDREERLARALDVAAADPPSIVQADVTDEPARLIPGLVERLRRETPGAIPVVVHSATLAYLDRAARDEVCDAIVASGARWISFEGPSVVGRIAERIEGPRPGYGSFVVALDGEPVAWAQHHGRRVRWGVGAGPWTR